VCVTELIEELVLVTVMPVGNLTVVLFVPLVLFVVLVGAKGNLELFVLVSNVSHNYLVGNSTMSAPVEPRIPSFVVCAAWTPNLDS